MSTPVAATGAWSLQKRNNAYQGRLLAGAFLPQAMPQNVSATPMGKWRTGVICSSSYYVSGTGAIEDLLPVAGGGMTINVHAGTAVADRPGQGPYVGWSDAAKTLTVDAAHSVNPRNDLVVMRFYDSSLGDTVPSQGPVTLEILAGQPNANPQDPPTVGLAGGGVVVVLARITVGANVTTITSANVKDLRKGLVSGTGPRPLLGGDSVTDPGYLTGELRYRGATGGQPEYVDVWGKDGQWHGLRSLPPVSTRAGGNGNTGAFATVGQTFTFASQTIPDPGFPYYVVASAQVFGTQGINLQTTAEIRLNSATGTPIGTSYDNPANPTTAVGMLYTIMPSATGILTGSNTIYWVLYRSGGTGNASGVAYANNSTRAMLTTQVIPA